MQPEKTQASDSWIAGRRSAAPINAQVVPAVLAEHQVVPKTIEEYSSSNLPSVVILTKSTEKLRIKTGGMIGDTGVVTWRIPLWLQGLLFLVVLAFLALAADGLVARLGRLLYWLVKVLKWAGVPVGLLG